MSISDAAHKHATQPHMLVRRTIALVLAGEIRGKGIMDEAGNWAPGVKEEIEATVRKVVKDIGYEQDGFHWEKPPVGTVQKDGLSSHNVVIDACQIASVHKDLAEPDPARRYKAVEWSHAGGARAKPIGGPHALVSPDGLRWTRISTQNLFRSNDVVTAFYDVRRKLWVALPKLSTPVRGTVRRCFGVTWTENLLDWPDPRLAFQPDLRDDAGTLARIEAVE